jgi:hypothetical protein
MNKPSRKEIDDEINRIYNEYGSLTPTLVVEVAKNPKSVLHHLFEWNDTKAGVSFRIAQARSIITSVKINIITETRRVSAVSYVRDPRLASDQQGYISVSTLRTDKDLAKESIKYEFQRAYAHLHRAKIHAEILGMEDQVSSLLNTFEDVRETMEV